MSGKIEFALRDWYPSEDAKRRLGAICQAVNETGARTYLLGTAERPYLLLEDADAADESADEWGISIDDAKANWSAVTAAALFFGARFRIQGKKRPRAILSAHPENRHPALRYRRPRDRNLSRIVDRLNAITDDLGALFEGLANSADLIDRRFRDIWRGANGMPPLELRTQH